jgi:hypothetical protein
MPANPYGFYPGETETIARMRALLAAGSKFPTIAKLLNDEGRPTRLLRKGNPGRWHARSVQRILERMTDQEKLDTMAAHVQAKYEQREQRERSKSKQDRHTTRFLHAVEADTSVWMARQAKFVSTYGGLDLLRDVRDGKIKLRDAVKKIKAERAAADSPGP